MRLPVQEATGLPYASKVTATDSGGKSVPVMHACGHDMHVTWLIGAATLFAKSRDAWKGTLMAVFQPAEETAQGAQAMIDDGLFKRFPKPDVMLGQHVMCMPAGVIGGRIGVTTSAADSLQIKLFGRGAHGSMPEASIDPVVMAAATVLRLQGIVSREVPPTEAAVVTIGVLQAGTKENVIPDEAIIKLNVRTFDEGVRKRVLAAIERIVNAEAEASGAPRKPEITPLDRYSLSRMIRMRPSEWAMRFARIFLLTACRRPSRRWRARTSDRSEPSGTFRRSSGSSGEWIVTCTRRRRGTARSAHFQPITARTSRRSSIQLWRQALKRWLSPRWLGWGIGRQREMMEPFHLALRMDTFHVVFDLAARSCSLSAEAWPESSTGLISSACWSCPSRRPTPGGSHAM